MNCRLRFERGISCFGLQPEILWALDQTVLVWDVHGMDYVTVTSGRGGPHSEKSLHNVGLAVDIRIWGIGATLLEEMALALRVALGPAFDVVVKPDHVHIEYQPKGEQQYLTQLAA